jgi:hypothetical protein
MNPTPEQIAETIAVLPAYVRVEIPTTYERATIVGQTRDLPRLGRRITTDGGMEFFATVENLTRVEAIGLTVKEFTL